MEAAKSVGAGFEPSPGTTASVHAFVLVISQAGEVSHAIRLSRIVLSLSLESLEEPGADLVRPVLAVVLSARTEPMSKSKTAAMVPNTRRAHAAFSRAHFRQAQMFAMTFAILRSPMLPVANSKMAAVNVYIMAAKSGDM